MAAEGLFGTQLGVLGFVGLLLVAIVTAVAVKYIRLPYTIALVLVGLGIGASGLVEIPDGAINRELIFLVMLPPLLFEGALALNMSHLRENLRTITAMAIPGVLLSTLIVGFIINGLFPEIPLVTALIFGAMIAPTDPVSVLALFKKLGAPKRLTVLVEGESLFNDGTGVVIFGILLTLLETNTLSITNAVMSFVTFAGFGIGLGLAVGYLGYRILSRIDDHLIEVAVTVVMAYGVFVGAETINHSVPHGMPIGVSEVLAVVAAGLVMGNYGVVYSMRAMTQVSLHRFWEFAAFIVNSLLFLLIGLAVDPSFFVRGDIVYPVAIAIGAMLFARAIQVYPTVGILNSFGERIPKHWNHVLWWGGLRGSIPLALILGLLSIPSEQFVEDFGVEHELLLHMVFGIALFSLVIQGLTVGPLINGLGLGKKLSPSQLKYERTLARKLAARRALVELEEMHRQGEISHGVYEELRAEQERVHDRNRRKLGTLLKREPSLAKAQRLAARGAVLRAQRAAVARGYRDGVLGSTVAAETQEELDHELASLYDDGEEEPPTPAERGQGDSEE